MHHGSRSLSTSTRTHTHFFALCPCCRHEHMDAFGFLDSFQDFLAHEHHWCDVVAGADMQGLTGAAQGLSLGDG
jgi:hypothetical protein